MSSFFISYSDLFLTKPKVRSGHGCSNVGQCYLLDKLSISIRETNYVISCGKKIYPEFTRGGMEPSAIGRLFPTSLTGDVKSEIKRTTGNEARRYPTFEQLGPG